MNIGLRQFAPGAQLTIRNPTATHGPGELTEQEAVERLSVLSLLARWVDQCDLIEAPDSSAGKAEERLGDRRPRPHRRPAKSHARRSYTASSPRR